MSCTLARAQMTREERVFRAAVRKQGFDLETRGTRLRFTRRGFTAEVDLALCRKDARERLAKGDPRGPTAMWREVRRDLSTLYQLRAHRELSRASSRVITVP